MFCLFKIKIFLLNLFSKKPYIPKDATQQSLFLTKYPEFDGRGIKIAIIDTGIDVSLEGLQKTSDGVPKIIDCFDFTGAGDVDTSVIKEMDSKNYLIGLSGRKFKIPKTWINPSGKWHLGVKALFKPSMSLTTVPGKLPEIDCIVWFDDQKWCACIDTFGENLKNAKVLTNFCDSHEYDVLLLKKIEITYCITIKNNGNLLQIYAPYHNHGSAISQIAAAYFPKKPEYNGLAPGAQLVLMSVMGPENAFRLDPENMKAIKKALLKCIEMKVDIINYSILSFAGDEEIGKLINEIYDNHNILLFKCAGNDGPFYSTVRKCDNNVENSIFTIGAILTPEMQERIYNVGIDYNNPPLPVVYNFSSRGPGANRSRGVDFVAEGAAFTKVSRFNCRKNLYFEGTSCSSPNAAGAVACLLSALKANSIQYSPALIKFALFKTAFLPENGNIFAFGHGIVKINAAFDYCKNKLKDFKNISAYNFKAEGIYYGAAGHQNIVEGIVHLSDFIDLETVTATKWILEVSPKAKDFIEVSKITENNSFSIKFNATKLEPGTMNFAEIMIMDPLIGSIFNIPVNLVYPLKVTETENYHIQKEITLNYEKSYQIIFRPIFENRKKCEIKITAMEKLITNLFIQHVKDDNNRMYSIIDGDARKILKFTPKTQILMYSFNVEKSQIFEICIYPMIYSPSNIKFKIELSFKNFKKEVAL